MLPVALKLSALLRQGKVSDSLSSFLRARADDFESGPGSVPSAKPSGFGRSATHCDRLEVDHRQYCGADRASCCDEHRGRRCSSHLPTASNDQWQGSRHCQLDSLGPHGKEYEL